MITVHLSENHFKKSKIHSNRCINESDASKRIHLYSFFFWVIFRMRRNRKHTEQYFGETTTSRTCVSIWTLFIALHHSIALPFSIPLSINFDGFAWQTHRVTISQRKRFDCSKRHSLYRTHTHTERRWKSVTAKARWINWYSAFTRSLFIE